MPVCTHRQRALKELDKRLSKVDKPTSWPSMDEGSSSQDEQSPTFPLPSSSSSLGKATAATSGDQLQAVVVEKVPGATGTSSFQDSTSTPQGQAGGGGGPVKPDTT